jgi:hypothetical protein
MPIPVPPPLVLGSPEQMQQALQIALQDPNCPKSYINGFNVGQTLTDIFIAMSLNGKIFEFVIMSFTTAKTLMVALQEAVARFEQQTGQEVLTMATIQQKMGEVQRKQ